MSDDLGHSMQALWKSSQLDGNNAAYLEAIYEDYLQDPHSIAPSWKAYFDQLKQPGQAEDISERQVREKFVNYTPTATAAVGGSQNCFKYASVMALINAYRSVGHQQASIDPLHRLQRPETKELSLRFHGLSNSDLNEAFEIPDFFRQGSLSLKEITTLLARIYCGNIGVEYMHITDSEEKNWLRNCFESEAVLKSLSDADTQKWLLQRLIAADGLEKYLGMKYVGQKRFSLEGGDALIPLLDYLLNHACDQGIKELVIGMAHRGRLNVLVNIMGKSPEDLFAEFEGKHPKSLLSGDVKYHNGFSSDRQTANGKLHVVLGFNPSHLESVDPVIEGSVRARQDRRDGRIDQVLAIQIHGDAAFCGQGVVMETLNMSQTRGYRTGGSIHIVINNQIGFTTSHPLDTRSTFYCTDVAKMIDAPIFHVNADDPEAVLRVAQWAYAYREKFHKDVVIDLVCYRLHGHNEADEPSATQPLMYQAIRQHSTPYKLYGEKLLGAKVISQGDLDSLVQSYKTALEVGKPVTKLIAPAENKKFIVDWAPYMGTPWDIPVSTTVPLKTLQALGKKLDNLPEGFALQRQVEKLLKDRAQMTDGKLAMNWGYGELMAYATLLAEGYNVRISGEDVGRGTFAHRHAVLHDQVNGDIYIPLEHVADNQGRFKIIDSLLSEEAVLGFEYGYSSSSPETLVIWEAQFGDFANMAQVVIDQFIASGEEKWGRYCGLVLFLPHGQEGMGAEHSSARLERFLQLCAHDNMQVCVPTTPAQHYHMLRRQMVRPFRKPLVVMTPKSLLRHPLVTSSLEDLANGQFHTMLPEIDQLDAKKVKRLVICQGKVYYDLLSKRREQNLQDVAIIRIEQLYPFPKAEFTAILEPYAQVADIIWCQEEPKNQGAWFSIQNDIRKYLKDTQTLSYVGREAFAAPAVGYPALHHEQQAALVAQALQLNR